MQSVKHQYPMFSEKVVARYVKTTLTPISGFRIDPNTSLQTDFLLGTPDSGFDFNAKQPNGSFSYEDEVLELYSEQEARQFPRINRYLFEQGLIKPYVGEAEDVDDTNVLDDTQVREIATNTNLKSTEKKLGELTSRETLRRVRDEMVELGRKKSFLDLVDARMREIE